MSSPGETLRAGVIGLGSIGSGIATSLARRGRVPAVFDLLPEAAKELPGPLCALGSATEVARASDVVCICVVDADQVADVVCGQEGVLSGAHPGLVIVVTATIAVRVIRELAEECNAWGVRLIDYAITRGDKAAENGLLALVGGADEVVRRARPVLDDFAGEVVHCGPVGSGMATKVAKQIVTAGRWRAVHESVELATAAGIDPAVLVHAIEASDPDRTALLGLQYMRMAGQTVDSSSRPVRHYLRNTDKDMAAAQELAAETGVRVPLVDLTRAETADTFAWLDEAERKRAP